MPITIPARLARRYYFPQQLPIESFAGGLNLRDAPSELAPTESPDCLNVTCDERGGIVKRLGYVKDNPAVLGGGNCSNGSYSDVLATLVVQAGTTLYKRIGASAYGSFKTFTTAARAGWCDFAGKLCIVHPADGFFTYDGAIVTAVGSGPKGSFAVPWGNRVLVGGDPGQKTRLYASARGDPGDWNTAGTTGAWTNDLRQVNDAILTAATVAPNGAALLVAKQRVLYRVYDSESGAYQALDPQVGTGSALGLATLFGRVAILSETGVYLTDGLKAPSPVSERLAPLFTDQALDYSSQAAWCAGVYRDRFLFSLRRAGQAANDYTLEYHPLIGWLVPHGFGASFFATYGKDAATVYHGHPQNGYVYRTFTGGADDGQPITARFRSKDFEPLGGMTAAFQRLRVQGRGQFDVFSWLDYPDSGSILGTVDLIGTSGTWDSAPWDGADWAAAPRETFADLYFPLPSSAKSASFSVRQISSSAQSRPALLGDGASVEVGDFALYGLLAQYTPLGMG